jgi:hypothetical protein
MTELISRLFFESLIALYESLLGQKRSLAGRPSVDDQRLVIGHAGCGQD